ncbi:hypothetical protein HHI36_014631 [Cryptolaemus montrouzieri]|uniref:RNA (guanine-9-)-methyltransferase domain-containing protein 1 n=1 Tax=Cryptolaemus montrouzieri TaxID=559131 RepID=A0ABD2N420_9CUCU
MHSFTRTIIYRMHHGSSPCLSNLFSHLFQNMQLGKSTTEWRPLISNLSTALPDDQHISILHEVSKGDADIEHQLKVLMLEVELLRQEGYRVPESHEMKSNHYTELLNLKSRSARRKYLEFLFKICRKVENRLKKKEETAKKLEEKRANQTPKDIPFDEFAQTYDLQHNNMFLRFRDTTMNNMYNNKLIQAMQFGQKLIVDCGYHNNMTRRENLNCSKQLMLLFGENRVHDDPFDLHFCNFDKNSSIAESLVKRICTLYNPEFPLNIHEQSYTKIFPKENLIYLTPHTKQVMEEYDHDALYIVGAIVDKVNQEPLSMAKAKQEGIRMMKLPLDKYLLWSGGSGKSLTLNQVIAILLDIKKTGNWEYSLRHVPKRKLVKFDEVTDIKKALLKKKERWTPKHSNLNQLSYNRSNFKQIEGNIEKRKKKFSVKSIYNE